MTHEEICTYELCKLAKEKGFNVPTAEFYNDDGNIGCYPRAFNHNEFPDGDYAAPTQSLLQRWLREEKKIEVYVRHFEETNKYPHHFAHIITDDRGVTSEISNNMFDTYEDALEDALKYVLEKLV